MARFPLIFYTPIYLGNIYERTTPLSATLSTGAAHDAETARLVTRALFYSALVSLFFNILLPPFIAPPPPRPNQTRTAQDSVRAHMRVPASLTLPSLWAAGHLSLAGCMLATLYVPAPLTPTHD